MGVRNQNTSFLLVMVVLAGCAAEHGGRDRGAVDATPDAGGDAAADLADAAAGACAPERTEQIPNGGPIEVGAWCDDIFVEDQDEASSADIEAVAPDFECEPGWEGSPVWRCHYVDGGVNEVTQPVLDQVCAASLVIDPDQRIRCYIYI
jgi:hypothetical protein